MQGNLTQKMLAALLMLGMLIVGSACGDSEGYYAELGGSSDVSGAPAQPGASLSDAKADDARHMEVARSEQMLVLEDHGFLMFEGSEVMSTFDGMAVTIRSSQRFGQLVVSWESVTDEIYYRVPNPLTGEAGWSRLTSVTEVDLGFIGYAATGEQASYEVEFYIADASQVDMIMSEATR